MIAATIGGAVIIAATAVDLVLTVLHPTRSGGLSRIAMTATWRAARAAAARLHREAIVGYAGPVMMLAQLAGWVLGLWLGFALIYAGHLDQLSYSPRLDAGGPGPLDALYLSGVALTTVGFGDLVAGSDALRLLSVAEAASGLAVFGAAIAYLLAVYPLVSEIRVTARQLACAQDHRGAVELVVHGGSSRLQALQRDLIRLDESTQRFPILYYFHAHDPTASLASAIRAASLITLQLRFGLPLRAAPHARWDGRVLDATLVQVIDHFRSRYHPHADAARDPWPTAEQIDRELRELREAAAQVTGMQVEDEPDRDALASLLGRSNGFLTELERRHLYPHQPV